jgi:WD40 repeat protein
MTRRLLSAVALILTGAAAVAAPLPKDTTPVITPDTVGRLRPVGELEKDVWRIVWGPQPGDAILLGWEKPAQVLDDRTFKPGRAVAEGKKPIHLAVSADREVVAWSENATRVEVLTLKTGKTLTIDTQMSQPDVAFSPDGKLLATGGAGTQAKLWELPSGKLVRTLDAGGEGGLTVVFSPDGKTLALGNRNHTTRLYEVATGKLLHTLEKAMTQGLKFRPDGKMLAVGYVDGMVALWDVETGKQTRAALAQVKEAYVVDWTPKGDLLVTAGREGKIVLWDPRELKPVKELDAPEWVIQARFTPDGARLWTAGGGMAAGPERKIVIWGVPDR